MREGRSIEKDCLGEKEKKTSLERVNSVLFCVFLAMNYLEENFEVLNLPNNLVNPVEKSIVICLIC